MKTYLSKLTFCLAAAALFISNGFAASRTWQNTATTTAWSLAGNWGGTAPVNGDDLLFTSANAGVTSQPNNNDLSSLSLRSLTFVNSTFNAGLTLGGNGITLDSAYGATTTLVNNNTTASRKVTFNNGITVTGAQTWSTVNDVDAITELFGNMAGNGTLTLQGLNLQGDNALFNTVFRFGPGSGNNSAYTGTLNIDTAVRFESANGLFTGAAAVRTRTANGVAAFQFNVTDANLANFTAGFGASFMTTQSGDFKSLTNPESRAGAGGSLIIDNYKVINNDRLSDSATIALDSVTLRLIGKEALPAGTVSEDVGPITYAGASGITISRYANTTTLQADSLARASCSRGTITLSAPSGTFGTQSILNLDANLTLVNTMATPQMVYATSHDFVTTSGAGPYTVIPFSGYTTYADQTSVTLGVSSEVSKVTFSGTSTGNALLQNSPTIHALNVVNSHASTRALDLNGKKLTIGSGGLIINRAGTAQAQIIGAAAGSELAFGANEAVIYANSTTLISSPITGSGGLTKFGSGTLSINNSGNVLTGGIVVNQGTLDVAATTEAGGAATTGKNPLTNAYGVTITVREGTFGGIQGQGTISPQSGNNGNLVIETPADTSFTHNGRLQDNGARVLTLKKTGDGTQTFGATSVATYTGTTAVNVGTLLVDGDFSAASGNITVATSATLGGVGTLGGALTVNNNGTIQPTISAANGGTLTLSSATAPTFNATAKLKIRAPSSTLDKVSLSHATPTFTCGNVALIIDTTGLSGNVTGATIVQTANASGISGTFASVTVVGNASYTPTLHYNANSITVDLVAAPSCTTPSSTITADAAVCASSTGNLASVPDANTGGNSGATYAWTISNGTITSAANIRQITYTAGASGSVTLNCTVAVTGGCSSGGAQNQTVSINDLPVANAGAYTCAPGLSVAIRVPDLASDPENATIFANVVVAPTNGTAAVVTIGGEPYFYYLNTNAAAASDAFTYTVSDGQCISASATISLTVAVSNTQSQNSLAPPETIGEGPDVRLKFLGLPGSHYALEWTHQLSPITNWVVLGTNVASVNGLVVFTNMPSGEVMDLYRTRWVP